MILDKEVEIYANAFNTSRYKKLGYDIKYGEHTKVKVEDLPDCFTGDVTFECDYCHCVFKRQWQIYIRNKKKCLVQKDACKECFSKKLEESMVLRYGVKNSMNLESTKEKVKSTNLERYGVENAHQNETIKEKSKNTCLERYGATSPLKNEQVKQKFINTNIERYGGKSPMCDKRVREKAENTNLEKYGVKNCSQNEEIRTRALQTRIDNYGINGGLVSSQQIYLWNLYGGEINYPFHGYLADIMFVEDNIIIEYSGSGHDIRVKYGKITEQEFVDSEETRRNIFLQNGYKEFEIISKTDNLPSDDFLLRLKNRAFDILQNTGHAYYGYNIDTNEEFYK